MNSWPRRSGVAWPSISASQAPQSDLMFNVIHAARRLAMTHANFTDEQGTQLSSSQAEKVYMACPLKSALKTYQERSLLWIPSIFQRGPPLHMSTAYHTVFIVNYLWIYAAGQSQCEGVNSPPRRVPAMHSVSQDSMLCRILNMRWHILLKIGGCALKPQNNRKQKLKGIQ